MKAAFVTDIKKVDIRDIAYPVIAENEVLLKTKVVGICGSDLHLFRGTHPFRHAPAILGHEISGEVIGIGAKVTRFHVGDRVTVEPQVGCGQCEMCRQGYVSLCGGKKVPGTAKWIGTFCQYFPADERTLYKLEEHTSYEMGALAEPLAVAVHALNHAQTKAGTLVILGGGTIGQLLLAVARHKGYDQIIVTDTAPFNREFALAHGASAALDPLKEDVPMRVKELNGGRGADFVIVAAGAPGILDQACSCLNKRGELCLVAMITEKYPFYSYAVVFNELKVYGSMCYEPKDFSEAVGMINGGLDLEDYATQVLNGLEEAQKGLDILSEKKENCVKVLIRVG